MQGGQEPWPVAGASRPFTAEHENGAHPRLAAALLSTSDPALALARVCEEIARITGCDRVQIWRGDLRQLSVHVQVAIGYDAIDTERLRGIQVPMQGLPLASDFVERKCLTISHADEIGGQGQLMFAEFGIRAAAILLIERGDHVLGALQLSWVATPTPEFPARLDIEAVRTYAALAVDMYARTDEALQTVKTLSDTAMVLASIHDPEDLVATMARRIATALGCDAGAVFLVEEHTEQLRFAAGVGTDEALAAMQQVTEHPDHRSSLLSAGDDDVVECSDVRNDLRGLAQVTGIASYLSVPLWRQRRLAGALTLAYYERTGRFARRQVTLAKGLAHHALVALETARLIRSLEEANRAKSDFVAAVSHDLRTPIHILVGFADMLLDGATGELMPEQRELVDKIRERSLQFRDLVDGILAVARLDAQRGQALAAPIRLDHLCTSVQRELEDRRAPGVALRVRARPLTIEVDAPKVRMILRNLVSNALKFTTSGEVALTADVADGTLRLCVTDSGPGIAADERAGIFEMFQQGSAGRRAGGSGLGLGLYLVRRLAQGMGGSTQLVAADPGRTVFEVTIPLPSTETPSASA